MSQTNQIELARAMSGVLERRVSLLESKDLLEVVRIEGFSKAMRANGIKVCFSADDNRCLSLNDSRRISLATDSSDKDVWDSFGAVFHIRTSFAELAEEFQDSVPEERLSLYSRWDRQFRGMQDQASFFLALDQETRVWMLDAPGILRPTGYFHAFDVKGWEKLLLEVIDDERMPSFLSSLPLFEFGRIEQHFFESLAGVKYLGLQEKVTRAIQKIENSYIRAKFTELVQEYWAM